MLRAVSTAGGGARDETVGEQAPDADDREDNERRHDTGTERTRDCRNEMGPGIVRDRGKDQHGDDPEHDEVRDRDADQPLADELHAAAAIVAQRNARGDQDQGGGE
jgi:hypothetical protein